MALHLDGAGPLLRVLPAVHFQILDHYMRRNEGQSRVIGTLLGTIVGQTIEVTNCFPVPHNETDTVSAIPLSNISLTLFTHLLGRGWHGVPQVYVWPSSTRQCSRNHCWLVICRTMSIYIQVCHWQWNYGALYFDSWVLWPRDWRSRSHSPFGWHNNEVTTCGHLSCD